MENMKTLKIIKSRRKTLVFFGILFTSPIFHARKFASSIELYIPKTTIGKIDPTNHIHLFSVDDLSIRENIGIESFTYCPLLPILLSLPDQEESYASIRHAFYIAHHFSLCHRSRSLLSTYN